MLNINQNFDLKAPVFNFDRDYFNSVEELNAYDASNVPNHFVTNVGGMLYQFTDGKWLPMIQTVLEDTDSNPPVQWLNLCGDGCQVFADFERNQYSYNAYGDNSSATLSSDGFIELDYSRDQTGGPIILLSGRNSENNSKDVSIGMIRNDVFGLDINGGKEDTITICIDKKLTEEEQGDGYSQVDMSLTDGDYSANINATHGFMHKTEDGFTSHLDGETLNMRDQINKCSIYSRGLSVYDENIKEVINLSSFEGNSLTLGSDKKFKISRPTDNTEGATITGIKSLTAFSNPSATKVWATDGSTVDLTTKANTSDLDAKANASDVLLKKSATGGYYIEKNSNKLGGQAFAANSACTASAYHSFAEGSDTEASGNHSHAEGGSTEASGFCSHAEGSDTIASGRGSHAQGIYNIDDSNAIHSVGIGNNTARKNAEYIYAKNDVSGYLVDDPKNGYKYLIGVGGYDGISTDNTTYKSVQEVIADLTARIEQLETKVRALEAANTPA